MFEKMKSKMIWASILIAVVAGITTGGVLWLCENGSCVCKKAKKALKKMSDCE